MWNVSEDFVDNFWEGFCCWVKGVFICSWKGHDMDEYGNPPYDYQKGVREHIIFEVQLYKCHRCHKMKVGK